MRNDANASPRRTRREVASRKAGRVLARRGPGPGARRWLAFPLLSVLVAATACASGQGTAEGRSDGNPSGGVMISADMIARSKATNALEALERARTHLTVQQTRDGSPVRIYHRGIDSLVNDPQVLVVIDGTPVSSPIARLRSIPAESIAYIQLLSGREATPQYGTLAGNGVIYVRTQATTARR